ncbi:PEP-CTERM sorting domain-containing protein [Roseibacillus persicicus]|uniref:PEP-CTERM sorting domain-containing protein n=1 Tax=Roseibacillus persicicus TaxID=454148 RepID=UPI00398AB311
MKLNKKHAVVTSVTAAVSSEAAVVQITQTGNSLLMGPSTPGAGEYTFADNLSADLTGDGVDDISITDTGLWSSLSGTTSSSPNYSIRWLGMKINGVRNVAGVGTSYVGGGSFCTTQSAGSFTTLKTFRPGEVTCNGSVATQTTYRTCGVIFSPGITYGNNYGGVADQNAQFSNSCETIEISFNDPVYGQVNGWLQVSQRGGVGITLDRVIFDTENPSVRPDVDCRDPAYAEASDVVPEPSSIAFLALGAGGVLLRRQRKAA